MPFTVSHAAAVLPLRRRWKLVFSALVVGSMAPDFEYFMIGRPASRYLHTFPGVLIATLPLAFAVLWVVQKIMKQPVVALLPEGFAARLDRRSITFWSRQAFLMIVLSLAIGIATHVAWDSITHENTFVSRNSAWEHSEIPVPGVGDRAVFKVLQWGSSAAGMFVLVAYTWFWYRKTQPQFEVERRFSALQKTLAWTFFCGSSGLLGFLRVWIPHGHHYPMNRYMFVITVVVTMSTFFWEVLTFCVLAQLTARWKIGSRASEAGS